LKKYSEIAASLHITQSLTSQLQNYSKKYENLSLKITIKTSCKRSTIQILAHNKQLGYRAK